MGFQFVEEHEMDRALRSLQERRHQMRFVTIFICPELLHLVFWMKDGKGLPACGALLPLRPEEDRFHAALTAASWWRPVQCVVYGHDSLDRTRRQPKALVRWFWRELLGSEPHIEGDGGR